VFPGIVLPLNRLEHYQQAKKGRLTMNVPEFVNLNDVKTNGEDIFADIWLRRIHINDQQTVSFRRPDGTDSLLEVSRHVHEGSILRLAGKGVFGRGYLVLHVRLIDY